MRLPVTTAPDAHNHIWLLSYKEWLANQPVTANTLRVYQSRVKQFLLFLEYANLNDRISMEGHGNAMPLHDPTDMSEVVGIYLAFLKESNRGKVTVNASISALNNFSHFLGLKNLPLKRERCYDRQAKVLSSSEQEDFLHALEQQQSMRDKALALTLFYTGLRIGDCARLNIGDITAGAASISLKNGTRISLNQPTIRALKGWLTERRQLAGADDAAQSALWLTKDGQRLTIAGIAFVIKRIGWQAKLALSAETLRRTWLAKVGEHLNKNELASRFGGYISQAAIDHYGLMPPPAQSNPAALEH